MNIQEKKQLAVGLLVLSTLATMGIVKEVQRRTSTYQAIRVENNYLSDVRVAIRNGSGDQFTPESIKQGEHRVIQAPIFEDQISIYVNGRGLARPVNIRNISALKKPQILVTIKESGIFINQDQSPLRIYRRGAL